MLARLRAMDPRRADLLLAGAFLVEALGELFLLVPSDAEGKPWVGLLLVAVASTLAVRRISPAGAALAAMPLFIAGNSLGDDYINHMVSPFFAAIVVLYGVGRHLEGRAVWLLSAYGVTAMWVSMTVDTFDDSLGNYVVSAGALIFGPVLLGRVLRNRARLNRALREVVLMDIRMPELDGIEATRRLVEAGGDSPARVLMLTTFDLNEYVYEALRAGASGFLLKDVPPEELAAGIRVVARGDALLAPAITRRLIHEFARAAPAAGPPDGFSELTAREVEVFKLVARGLSNAEIAAELIVSETTIKTHVARLLMKLGLRDRVQAVVLAYESGIAVPGAAGS